MAAPQYSYSRAQLLDRSNDIRLLYIERAEWYDDPLRGHLEVFSLNELPRKYTTLSYCWGSQLRKETLDLSGAIFEISKSVAHALRHVRKLTVRWIWVDQICINQADVVERSEQILLMRTIYSRSYECFVYLGKGSGKNHVGDFNLLKEYIESYRGDLGPAGKRKVKEGCFNDDKEHPGVQWRRCLLDIMS